LSTTSIASDLAGGIARLTLNRPDKRNALDASTIAALTAELQRCAADPKVRVVQITGAGEVFCAGADLSEMQAQARATEAENLVHARLLATLLGELDSMPKPTLARVNGDGYGGALGLMAACDIVVAADHAKFAFTEVRLGIIPAVVSPFVLAKIGERAALRYVLTAETMTSATLKEIGLVHEVAAAPQLDSVCNRMTDAILKGAPGALSEAKILIRDMANAPARRRSQDSLDMAARLARLRVSDEAQEGISAFFVKRRPSWRPD
jgi:methylglutaconyl-CoA hydratase